MKLVEQRVIDFVAATASKEPTPGGGAIAALTAATGAALAEMVANLTFGKKGYEAVQTEMEALQAKAEEIRNRMLELSHPSKYTPGSSVVIIPSSKTPLS